MAVACWDALISSLAYLVLIPALALIVSPWFLLAYVLDVPVVVVPLAATAVRRRELRRAVASLPALYVLRSITVVYSAAKILLSDTPQPQLDASGTVVETTSQPVEAASLELLPIAPVLVTSARSHSFSRLPASLASPPVAAASATRMLSRRPSSPGMSRQL